MRKPTPSCKKKKRRFLQLFLRHLVSERRCLRKPQMGAGTAGSSIRTMNYGDSYSGEIIKGLWLRKRRHDKRPLILRPKIMPRKERQVITSRARLSEKTKMSMMMMRAGQRQLARTHRRERERSGGALSLQHGLKVRIAKRSTRTVRKRIRPAHKGLGPRGGKKPQVFLMRSWLSGQRRERSDDCLRCFRVPAIYPNIPQCYLYVETPGLSRRQRTCQPNKTREPKIPHCVNAHFLSSQVRQSQ